MSSLDRHDPSEVPEGVRADLFASEQRCQILRALAAAGGEASVRDLALRTRVRETGRPADRIDPDTVESLRYDIYDRHLPKLAATGVVEYDSVLDKLRLLDPEIREETERALDG